MRKLYLIVALACAVYLALLALHVEAQAADAHDMSGMSMPENSSSHADQAMSNHHLDMGPHMRMTDLRPSNPADQQRADDIVRRLRASIEKYQDYRVALADGYKIFMPNAKTPMKHFTNWRYAMRAGWRFDPEHPTSLLYEQHGDSYKLVGAMFTAPKRYGEEQLDQRVPLSVAQWHEHVDFCKAPKGSENEYFGKTPRFGLLGSITSKEECDAAGGKFYPVLFNWMVHVYPWETTREAQWSLERQSAGHQHMD